MKKLQTLKLERQRKPSQNISNYLTLQFVSVTVINRLEIGIIDY